MAHYKKGRGGFPTKKRDHRTPGESGRARRMESRKRARKSALKSRRNPMRSAGYQR